MPPSSAESALARVRSGFEAGLTRPSAFRLAQLSQLRRLVEQEEDALLGALERDLGKPRFEGWLSELALVKEAVSDLSRRVPKLVRRRQIRLRAVQQPARASVSREPLGCCLVVSPWNFPLQLLLIPLATAIAAGNVVVAKPSELAPATSAVLAELLPRFLDPRAVAVVEGGAETTKELIALGVDHVFFTGSTTTGKAVMAAAAEHLTPVTLELGGKSPVYVDADADLTVTARRIVFGKFLNAGQSCVAPDYVLAHAAVKDRLIAELRSAITAFYGVDPKESTDFGRIVNDAHFERIRALVDHAGGQIVHGGGSASAQRFIEPTIIDEPSRFSTLMSEEIFGPVLPICSVANAEVAVAEITAKPAPLAIYCFTESEETMERFRNETSSGALCQNTAVEQFAAMRLPFGGIGQSGMGAYHGDAGLLALTHPRAHLEKRARPDLGLGYPPWTRAKRTLLRRALGR